MNVSRLLDQLPMPARMARLPRNPVGYPIPWFVATLADGSRDFRIAGQEQQVTALRLKLCWVCGQPLGGFYAFTIGPMCAVNRISSEPPAHRDCAVYSARVCPFLSNPNMRRRALGEDQEVIAAAGGPILRNPGVTLVWVTRSYKVVRAEMGNAGLLCEMGDPTETLWFTRGRPATRAEVEASFEAGLPVVREACQVDDRPEDSLRAVEAEYQRALTLLPR